MAQLSYLRARQALVGIDRIEELLPKIQTLCILVVRGANVGNGLQALSDIGLYFPGRGVASITDRSAMANGLLRILKSDNSSAKYVEQLMLVESFLDLTEHLHTLGHSRLKCSKSCQHDLRPSETLNSTDDSETQRVLQLTKYLYHIDKVAAHSFTDQSPPAWHATSMFMEMQRNLDQFRLFNLDTFSLQSSAPLLKVVCVILWHSCILSLNRGFLPVPLTRGTNGRSASHIRPGSVDRVVHMPNAPKPFIQGRINVCNSSASDIAVICCQLMERTSFVLVSCACNPVHHDFKLIFQSPILGFACFQAAAVLINQVRCRLTCGIVDAYLDLKTVLTVLGALRRFFQPSCLWVSLPRSRNATSCSPTLQGQCSCADARLLYNISRTSRCLRSLYRLYGSI